MRIWVDPMKLNSYQLTMADVTSAVQAQNAQVSAGQLGNLPAPRTQELNATVSVQSRLQTPEEFGAIRLKTARRRLGRASARRRPGRARRREIWLQLEIQRPSGGGRGRSASRRAPTRSRRIGEVKAKIGEISKQFPSDVKVIYPWDTTPFVKVSLRAGRRDPVRGDGARLPGDVPVPAEHPRDLDPDHRHPGRAASARWR